MTTPTVNTLALVPPRRPTIEDLGGEAKENDAKFPPNPVTQPTAEDWNEKVRMLAAAWRTVPVAVIPVTFVAGVPTIGDVQCGNPALVAGDFTPTDHGGTGGDTTIAWAADTFPAAICPAVVEINMTTGNWFVPIKIPGTNEIRIQTPDSTSTLADADFTLFIF
jgi:hypothetical protein